MMNCEGGGDEKAREGAPVGRLGALAAQGRWRRGGGASSVKTIEKMHTRCRNGERETQANTATESPVLLAGVETERVRSWGIGGPEDIFADIVTRHTSGRIVAWTRRTCRRPLGEFG